MSLNGLDDHNVNEAYQSALAEAGGWFLLKYVARDAVEVLTRGSGGVAEARAAVAQYTEVSPLYGFLLYRRRKVVIKYIPEGTSRLHQGMLSRVTVHFQDVTDKFLHDAVLSIRSAEELNDATLAAECASHTLTASSSSSNMNNSNRQTKLGEITEEAEEARSNAQFARPIVSVGGDEGTPAHPTTRVSALELPDTHSTSMQSMIDLLPLPPKSPTSPTAPRADPEPILDPVTFTTIRIEPTASEYAPSTHSITNSEYRSRATYEPWTSTSAARPSISEIYNAPHLYKPKIRLGPRPLMDWSGRPRTAGSNASYSEVRAISTLPAGMRVAQRKPAQAQPQPTEPDATSNPVIPPTPPVPEDTSPLVISLTRKISSAASAKSLPATISSKASGMTHEKLRLMKALELRKKQMCSARALAESKARVDEAKREWQSQEGAAKEQREAESRTRASTEHSKADSGVDMEIMVRPAMASSQLPPLCSPPASETDSSNSASASPLPASGQSESPEAAIAEQSAKRDSMDITADASNVVDFGAQQGEAATATASESNVIAVPGPVVESTVSSPATPDVRKEPRSPNSTSHTRNKRSVDSAMKALRRHARNASSLSNASDFKSKRRGLVDPLNLDTSAENSEADYMSDDDSFMEELQTATVQEVKPISVVSKSPIMPFFPSRRPSQIAIVRVNTRSMSHTDVRPKPQNAELLPPDRVAEERPSLSTARSDPGSPREDPMAIAEKAKVSSGISKRIKALAEKTTRDSLAANSAATSPTSDLPSPKARSDLRTSLRSLPSRSPTALKSQRFSYSSATSLQPPVLGPNPFDSVPARQSRNSIHTIYNIQQRDDRPESVSVTARIIRDHRTDKPDLTMPTEMTPLDLHQSPITIDRHSSTVTTPTRATFTKPDFTSPVVLTPPTSRESSVPALPRTSSETSWRSIGRRMSEVRSHHSSTRSASNSSLDTSFEPTDDKREDRRSSRTSRLFRRMSSTVSASRKSLIQVISSPVKEEEQERTQLPAVRELPRAVVIGDLNVQFPDTLLWKRRWVEIDSHGNIVLSLSKTNEHPRGITKRYHMTEFCPPSLPDQDRQEMPYSVIVDFIDGRSLQCACEDYIRQARVLKILQDSHRAWMTYEQ